MRLRGGTDSATENKLPGVARVRSGSSRAKARELQTEGRKEALGEGEKAGQEPTASPVTAAARQASLRARPSSEGQLALRLGPSGFDVAFAILGRMCVKTVGPGRDSRVGRADPAGNRRTRWMAAAPKGVQNPAYRPAFFYCFTSFILMASRTSAMPFID